MRPAWRLVLFSCTVQTDGQVHYKCTEAGIPNIWAEQSVCTSLDEYAVTQSILIGSKNARKGGGTNF